MLRLFTAVLAALVSLAVFLPGEAAADVTRYAIVVGNNQGLSRAEALRYAEQDARRMAGLLQEIGGVLEENVVLLEGEGPKGLRRAFDEIAVQVEKEKDDVVFLFYYSGHADSGYLRMNGRGISIEEVRRRLEIMPAKVRVAIVDACQSGEITRAKGGKVISPFMEDQAVNMEGLVILTSASAAELAQESETLKSSYFSHHLMSGLRGAADTTGDGRVSAVEAYEYAYRYTVRETQGSTVGAQHPTFLYAVEGEGDIALTAVKEGRARVVLPDSMSGSLIFFGEGGRIEAEMVKRKGESVQIALFPGQYEVRWRSADTRWGAQIDLKDGDVHRMSTTDFVEKPLVTAVAAKGGKPSLQPEKKTGEDKSLGNTPLGGGASWGGGAAVSSDKPSSGKPSQKIEDEPKKPKKKPSTEIIDDSVYDDSNSFARRPGARLPAAATFGGSLLLPGLGQGMDGRYRQAGIHTGVWLISLVAGSVLVGNMENSAGKEIKATRIATGGALLMTAFYTHAYSATEAFYTNTKGGPGYPDLSRMKLELNATAAPIIVPVNGTVVGGMGGGLGMGFAVSDHVVLGLRNINVIPRNGLLTFSLAPELKVRGMFTKRLGWSAALGCLLQANLSWDERETIESIDTEEIDNYFGAMPYVAGFLHYFPARSISLDFGARGGVAINQRRVYGNTDAVQVGGAVSVEYVGGLTWYWGRNK